MNYITIDRNFNIREIGFQSFRFGDMTIFLDGLIYVYGIKAGNDTVKWLYETVQSQGNIPFEELRGAYVCIIRQNKKIIAFCDNSNMHCIYYSEQMISTSFLKMINKDLDFDLEAVCEYLTLGNVFFDKTFFKNIRILNSSEIAVIEENKITIIPKPIRDIDGPCNVSSINDYFDRLAYSLSDLRICQALTGGYDSRMIYACLSNKINDHPAISGNNLDDKDIKCASEVANTCNAQLDIIKTEKPVFSEKIIWDLFEIKDGIIPFDLDADIRLFTFKTKLARDYDVHLTGDGGVLHKDWEWTQDLPFYRKRKSNAKRFYRQRLYYLSVGEYLGEALKDQFINQEKRFEDELKMISKSLNTQSYDSWYYKVSGNRRTAYNYNPMSTLISYAPLNELDVVRYSYALPRRKRFFYNSIRNTITKENKAMARIKTNYGTNASDELLYIIPDVFCQIIEYIRKAYRVIGRKMFNKNLLNNSVLNWSLEKELRNSDIAHIAIKYAQQRRFIDIKLQMKDLPYIVIQRLIHLYCLMCINAEK